MAADWSVCFQRAGSFHAAGNFPGKHIVHAHPGFDFPPGFTGGEVEQSSYLFAAGLGGMGLLMVPSAVYAARGLFGSGKPCQLHWGSFAWIGYIAPLPLLLGFGIQNGPDWARGLLPVAHVPGQYSGSFLSIEHRPGKNPWGAREPILGGFCERPGADTPGDFSFWKY